MLDVFVGDEDEIMTHARWPVSDCWFPSGRSLKETLDYFGAVPDVQDPLAYLGGRVKAPYRFLIRKPRLQEKDSQYIRKTEEEEIWKVSSLKCCKRRCCQFFPRNKTLLVRQKFYLKSFEDHREYGLAVGAQLHTIDGIRKHKYITLEGVEVCGTAWYSIHGILKSTYHNYIGKYHYDMVSGAYRNKGIKQPRIGTVQAMGTMVAIIHDNAN